MTKQEEKQRLRRVVRGLEERLSPRYLELSGQAIAARLLARREVDTRPILENALARRKTLCLPLCTGPGQMELRQVTALEQLVPGAFGIPAPPADSPLIQIDDVDFAILPCVTCDRSGRRLGRGGGFYDRFLSHYRGGSVLLCRERLIREEIPVEPHDCPVPWVLTERGLYEDGVPARLG